MSLWRTLLIAELLGGALSAFGGTDAIISAIPSAPRTGGGGSFVGSFSPDGQFLLFYSHAKNLATNEGAAPFLDVFARNLLSGVTTLISVSTNDGKGGNDHSPFATMSTNGLVAFESRAGNLTANDTNDLSDVFVRDLAARTTILVSANSNGTQSAFGTSTGPLISQDGRRVIFESTATNLAAGDSNRLIDIYVRDLVAGTTALVSRDATNAGFGAGPSETPSISADGRYVAFAKGATNYLPSNRQSQGEIYVRDLVAGVTIWASSDANTNFIATSGYPYRFYNPVLSADGRYVAFFGEGPFNSSGPLLFRKDLVQGTTLRLAIGVTNAFGIPMSADGRVLAWVALGSNPAASGLRVWDEESGTAVALSTGNHSATASAISADGRRIAWFTNQLSGSSYFFRGLNVFDRNSGSNQLASLTTNGSVALPTEPSVPALSPDGERVAFETEDARLADGDENGASDVFVHDLGLATTELVSAAQPELPQVSATGMASLAPGALSADGRFVVFTALDGNLMAGDTNKVADVFVRDLQNGNLVAASGYWAPGPGGGKVQLFPPDAINSAPVISGDGRVVVYRRWRPWSPSSGALYWRDLAADLPVALLFNGVVTVTNSIVVNHDGSQVAFDSHTSALDLGLWWLADNNGTSDVFLRDVAAGTNALVSVNQAGNGTGNGASVQPVLSPDGQWIAFLSRATNLTTNTPLAGIFNAYVRRLPSGPTRLLSEPSLLQSIPAASYGLSFSADSRTVIFGVRLMSSYTNVYQHSLSSGTTKLVCGGCQDPSVNADGRFVSYVSQGYTVPNGFRTWQVAVKDMVADYESLISVSTNGLGPAYHYYFRAPPLARIGADGRYVVFTSTAPDLATTDTNLNVDLFARDRIDNRTYHLSLNTAGTGSANGFSSALQMSGDGRAVALQSHADDLAPGDYNHRRDVFILRLAEPDGDRDGMDDDWEMAYFSTLDRDGLGDFDGDGAGDRHEFGAGTDPTNTGSIFRILSLSRIGSNYTLFWGTEPGMKYQVQSRDLDAGTADWINRGLPYSAGSTTGSMPVHPGTLTTNRFYRVVRLK